MVRNKLRGSRDKILSDKQLNIWQTLFGEFVVDDDDFLEEGLFEEAEREIVAGLRAGLIKAEEAEQNSGN